jgi:uncharacterized protein YggE
MRIILLLLCFMVIHETLWSQEPNRTISVRGEYTEEFDPDDIIFNFTIILQEKSNKENMMDQKEKELIDLLKRNNVDVNNLHVERLGTYLSSEFYYSNRYRTFRNYTLTLENNSKIDTILWELYDLGVTSYKMIDMTSHDIEKFREQACLKAYDVAKQRAENLAIHSGTKLGRISKINEVYPDELKMIDKSDPSSMMFGNLRGVESLDISFKKIKIKVVLELTFELE